MSSSFKPNPDYKNNAMMMDFYEMTMANAYFLTGQKDTRVLYDMFFRRVPDGGGSVSYTHLTLPTILRV